MKLQSLYRQALGADFSQLPLPLQRFHSLQGAHVLSGWVQVEAPASLPARLLARCLGAPLHAQEGPIRFELQAEPALETWTRHFPGKTMMSRLALRGGRVVEHLGAARLDFILAASAHSLEMRLAGLRFLGVPCPGWLRPAIVAQETARADRLHFRVQASLPWVGVVAGYRGHLDMPEGERP